MRTEDVVVIGGGQAGLAMSRCLTERSIGHVVLERDEVASSWRHQRWDSLRLLTPNWMNRLPGFADDTDDPDGYRTAAEVVAMLEAYRASFDPPVLTGCEVTRVASCDPGFVVHTSQGPFSTRAVVLATGAFRVPRIPAVATDLPSRIRQLAPIEYRNPEQLEPGGVLVVGASASGAQVAEELARSGREVTLAVGEHLRVPRTYRGLDIHAWMEMIGHLEERYDEVVDIGRARRLPSPQLVGSPERRSLDLNTLVDRGVTVTGRLVGIDGTRASFSGSLRNQIVSADLKQSRLLDRVDELVAETGLEVGPADRPWPTRTIEGVNDIDLSGIGTVVWATGFAEHHPWLEDDLCDRKGAVIHDGGVLARPGLYILGLPFLRRRASSFIDGTGRDAEDLATHLAGHLGTTAAVARSLTSA